MTTTTFQLRIDKATKAKAQAIFKKMGMDMSAATKLFLTEVVRTKSIPFIIRTENGFTPEYEAELLTEFTDIEKNGKRFKTVDALMEDLNK